MVSPCVLGTPLPCSVPFLVLMVALVVVLVSLSVFFYLTLVFVFRSVTVLILTLLCFSAGFLVMFSLVLSSLTVALVGPLFVLLALLLFF